MKNISIKDFGKDHWSLLAYVEYRAVNHKGFLDIKHLRCKNLAISTTPLGQNFWKPEYGSRLKGYFRKTINIKGKEVKVGRYVDVSDSLHLYGSYLKDIEPEIEKMKEKPMFTEKSSDRYTKAYLQEIQRNIEQRTWPSDHPAFKMMTEEARENLKRNPDFYAEGDR